MCGTETTSPTSVKIEGAELDVCDNCTEFGTKIQQTKSTSTSTKYSTGSTSSGSSQSGTTGQSSQPSSSPSGSRRDMFDEMEEVVDDYDDRIRHARESENLTQDELANQLNEKASLIRKLERGDVLPSDRMQRKLERALNISLSAGGDVDDSDWSSGASPGTTTLGDVVKRKE